MKTVVAILSLVTVTSTVFAQNGDATPSAQSALKAAQDFVYDTAFANILDEGSSVLVQAKSEDANQYLFTATARNPGVADCKIEVKVSKETGMAFQDEIMPCQNLAADTSK